MRRKIVSGIMLSLLLIGMFILAFNIQPIKAEPTTWTVDDDGTADFSKIQEAINAAGSGDTIYVKAGTYYEHVVVNTTVSLIGENRKNTIIDGNGTGSVVYVIANNVKISGFTIQKSGPSGWHWFPDAGILIDRSGGNKINHNKLVNNKFGVFLSNSLNNSVFDNIASSNWVGIMIFLSSNNVIYRNNITNNGHGIALEGSQNNIISGNDIKNMGIGIALEHESNYNTISGNSITNHDWYGIILSEVAHYNTIYGNNIANNDLGVALDQAMGNRFYHNNFINNNNVYPPGLIYNFWDNGYPSGGNYWSDYTGVDLYSGPSQNITGSDGIGDTPYVIDYENQDNYPLMNPWTLGNEIRDLIRDVEDMNLQQGIDNSLDAKLTATLDALEALNADKRNDAINKLYAFLNEVEAQREKKLTNEQSDYLTAAAQEIISLINLIG